MEHRTRFGLLLELLAFLTDRSDDVDTAARSVLAALLRRRLEEELPSVLVLLVVVVALTLFLRLVALCSCCLSACCSRSCSRRSFWRCLLAREAFLCQPPNNAAAEPRESLRELSPAPAAASGRRGSTCAEAIICLRGRVRVCCNSSSTRSGWLAVVWVYSVSAPPCQGLGKSYLTMVTIAEFGAR